MHTFLDESGPFIPLEGDRSRVSVVGGLILPTQYLADIYGEYLSLRPTLALRNGEVKGSAQSEDQVARVVALLSKYNACLEVTCVDLGQHTAEDIRTFQRNQADSVTANIPADYPPQMREHINRLGQRVRDLPPQLFVQAYLYIHVIDRIMRSAFIYYVQRLPSELGSFAWVVDRKAETITPFEELWRELIMPILQTKSEDDPMIFLEDADYSHFAPFLTDNPRLTRPLPPVGSPERAKLLVVNLRALFAGDLRFVDSRDEVGLELADIVISGASRALNDTLQENGWNGLGKLMIRTNPRTLYMTSFSDDAQERIRKSERFDHYSHVADVLHETARPMFD